MAEEEGRGYIPSPGPGIRVYRETIVKYHDGRAPVMFRVIKGGDLYEPENFRWYTPEEAEQRIAALLAEPPRRVPDRVCVHVRFEGDAQDVPGVEWSASGCWYLKIPEAHTVEFQRAFVAEYQNEDESLRSRAFPQRLVVDGKPMDVPAVGAIYIYDGEDMIAHAGPGDHVFHYPPER